MVEITTQNLPENPVNGSMFIRSTVFPVLVNFLIPTGTTQRKGLTQTFFTNLVKKHRGIPLGHKR